ncbi:MAG: MSHA biogenesis protein MshP [Shewanella sp.]|nr:MSHA biogenesis protein MshP [Shewanella sp.]MCF1429500.1 MSHA biogenesis protein MshP [Shewanella sp.]MCF1438319.1 MSHA biogenesis protein MshP [Shewanella sp.]MCF1457684.1 MSHA biogenesis protein MshP [Shewanella sp.]
MQRIRQTGSSLVLGIFIITVMFAMSTALLRVLEDADDNVNLEVFGIRALLAANSGADAVLAQLFPPGGGAATNCAAVSNQWTPPDLPGFSGCQVTLGCNSATVIFKGKTMHQFTITSSAICQAGQCSGGAGGDSNCLRVNRIVEVQARDN